MDWIDQYTGKHYRITTAGDYFTAQTARVKTYGEVLRASTNTIPRRSAQTEGGGVTTGGYSAYPVNAKGLLREVQAAEEGLEDTDNYTKTTGLALLSCW